MDLTWLKDYGAFVAASVAAIVTIVDGVLQARRDARFKKAEWLRQMRIARYAAFVRAAHEYTAAILWQHCEPDPQITGPKPEDTNYEAARKEFTSNLAEVKLVGPSNVSRSASFVRYACWRYINQLEGDPFRYDHTKVERTIEEFQSAVRDALGIEGRDERIPKYQEWVKEQGKDH